MRLRTLLAGLILILFVVPSSARAAGQVGPVDDVFLRGYIVSFLEQVLEVGRDRVEVTVENGVVTLTGTVATPETIDRIVGAVVAFQGVRSVVNRLEAGDTGAQRPRWRTWTRWLQPSPGRKTVRFPMGDLFTAPLADQKQPRFHMTWQRWHTGSGAFDIASVGFGENFGILRWPHGRPGDGWQLGISGAVFAIFNLDTSSLDLLNSDYCIGFPVSYRNGRWSGRVRLYHQSSHLGDEFLLQPEDIQPVPAAPRINLSYEALELLGSYEREGARFYAGGTRILSIDPSGLGRSRLQAGVEYRGNPIHWHTSRLVAGLDVEAWSQTDWDRDWSAKAGLMFRSPYGDARSIQLLLEYYNGHAPHGQFFPVDVEYYGIGVVDVF
jgi:uncharacterized protein DUF1207/BON domain-containing protein